jgi:Ca2+-transporting ATPase
MTEATPQAWHAMTGEEALAAQAVDVAAGLSAAEVERRRSRFGPNAFAEAPKEPRWRAFARQYEDPMQVVLLVAGIISLFLPGQIATGIVLILLTVSMPSWG